MSIGLYIPPLKTLYRVDETLSYIFSLKKGRTANVYVRANSTLPIELTPLQISSAEEVLSHITFYKLRIRLSATIYNIIYLFDSALSVKYFDISINDDIDWSNDFVNSLIKLLSKVDIVQNFQLTLTSAVTNDKIMKIVNALREKTEVNLCFDGSKSTSPKHIISFQMFFEISNLFKIFLDLSMFSKFRNTALLGKVLSTGRVRILKLKGSVDAEIWRILISTTFPETVKVEMDILYKHVYKGKIYSLFALLKRQQIWLNNSPNFYRPRHINHWSNVENRILLLTMYRNKLNFTPYLFGIYFDGLNCVFKYYYFLTNQTLL